MSTKIEGRVSAWFDAKNFGFLHQNKDGHLVSFFFHRKHLIDGIPATGKTVRFNPVAEEKGLVARDVEVLDDAFNTLAGSANPSSGVSK